MPTVDEMVQAIQAKDLEKAKALLAQDKSLAHARVASGDSTLLLAAYHRAWPIVDLFLARGAVPNVWEGAAVGKLDRVRALVNADPTLLNAHSHDGWTPLHLAAHFGQKQVAAFLISKGAQLDARSTNALANTPLHAAVAGRQHTLIALLLQHGADVDATYERGMAGLHVAAASGDDAAVRLLLQNKARVDVRDADGKTALDHATQKGHERVMRLLRVE